RRAAFRRKADGRMPDEHHRTLRCWPSSCHRPPHVKSVRIALLTLAALAAASCSGDRSASSSEKKAVPLFTQTAFLTKTLQTTLSASDIGAGAARRGHG